jgi:hypothetical protein
MDYAPEKIRSRLKTKIMKQPKFLIALLIFILAAAVGVGQRRTSSPSRDAMGKIQGVVLDANDARIVGATITIETPGFKRQLKSGDEGNFELRLPAGVYLIKADASGFRNFELSPLTVKANVSELINIHMEVGSISDHSIVMPD